MIPLEGQENIAIIPGSFKPPTKGHLFLLYKALQIPNIKKILIYISEKERGGISGDISKQIWNMYGLPNNVIVDTSPHSSPVMAVYDYAYFNPDKHIYMILGARNAKEITEANRKFNIVKEFPNVELKMIKGNELISGTNARKELLNKNKTKFFQYLPPLTYTQQNQIWTLLND